MASRPESLVRISTLARLSEVPPATIKHYLREGLLPEPASRTARNMAFYDRALVPRVRLIKQLQRDHFLPLRVIKQILAEGEPTGDVAIAAAVAKVTRAAEGGGATRTRAELLAAGVAAPLLDALIGLGLLAPEGPEQRFPADDVELLRLLAEAERAGLGPGLLPPDILQSYAAALRALVRVELELFRAAVAERSPAEVAPLAEAATRLSERLVVLLRRRLLLPTLQGLTGRGAAAAAPGARRPARPAPAADPPPARRAARRREPARR